MKIVNKKIVITTMLLVAVTTSVLICGLSSDKETQLDSVKLKEEVNSEMFAIMLEQSDGTYKESSDNTWPEDMQYNAEKSGCVDINGNKIEGVLEFDSENNIASVNTTSTSYCYLYFSIPPLTVSVTVTNNGTSSVALNVLSNKDGTYCLIKESVSTTECIDTGDVVANEILTIGAETLSKISVDGLNSGHGSFNTTFTVIVTDSSGATMQESVAANYSNVPI